MLNELLSLMIDSAKVQKINETTKYFGDYLR